MLRGIDRGLSPEINVCNDPRFGRTEENFGEPHAKLLTTLWAASVRPLSSHGLLCACLCAGEDPAHVAAMAVAAVTGLQGGSASPSEYLPDNDHIVCEAKHCCAYGAGGRDGNSADISQKTLHDVRNPHEPFVLGIWASKDPGCIGCISLLGTLAFKDPA